MHNATIRAAIVCILLGLIMCLPFAAFGLEIKGSVVDLQGKRIKIAYQSEYVPRKGDIVRIGFQAPGEDFIPVEGHWMITEVAGEFAWAEPEGGPAGTPALDYLALIESKDPVSKSDLEEPQKTPAHIDPGGGALGVLIKPLSPDIRREHNLPAFINGVLVHDVKPGSAAEQGGIRRGDVIVEFEGIPFTKTIDLSLMVSSMAPGTRARLIVFRDGQIQNLTVTLGRLGKDLAEQYLYVGTNNIRGKRYGEALFYLERSAKLGRRDAYFHLGRMYENGWGVPKDEARAMDYYRQYGDYVKEYQKGAGQGIKEARDWLKKRGLTW